MSASLNLKLAACFEHFEPLSEAPADLRARLQALGINVRRINRFTELALLGAAGCHAQLRAPARDTAIYLASEASMLADCVKALRGLVDHQKPPTPFEFMNISGNMAGFYIAQQLQLEGPQLAVHRRGAALEAILELLPIAAAGHRRALVGYVEEGVWPLDEQRRRLRLPEGTPLTECSHWLMFDADCARPIGVVCAIARGNGVEAFQDLAGRASYLACGAGIDQAEWSRRLHLELLAGLERGAAYSNGSTAQALCRYALAPAGKGMLHVSRAEDGMHYGVLLQCDHA